MNSLDDIKLGTEEALEHAIEQFIASGSEIQVSPFRRYDDIFHFAFRLLKDIVNCTEIIVFGETPDYVAADNLTILYFENCSLDLDCIYTTSDVDQLEKSWKKLTITSVDHGKSEFKCYLLYKARLNLKTDSSEKITRVVGNLLSELTKKKSTALWDKIVQIALGTKSHSSFFYKALVHDLMSYVSLEGASIFFQMPHERALTLASTTGLKFGRNHQFKREDIKYHHDSKSFVRTCFETGKAVFEMATEGESLKENTYGEDVDVVFNRLFLPIRVRPALIDEMTQSESTVNTGKIGVLRAVNFRRNGLRQPISRFEDHILNCFCEFLSVLGTRYIKSINAESDIERATHGYITDLLTLKWNFQVYDRIRAKHTVNINRHLRVLSDLQDTEVSKSVNRLIQALLSSEREWEHMSRDFHIIQDAMSAQLNTVLDRSDRVMGMIEKDDVNEVCERPFVEVLMRLADACGGLSRFYNRLNFEIKFDGGRATSKFMKIPSVAIPQRTLFYAARNIIENSVKYTPKNQKPQIDIGWSCFDGKVYFDFHDGGIGISSDVEAFLFVEEGFRSREAIICNLRGNGLGLIQSREMMRAGGGDLTYVGKSKLLGGAHFRITAPVHVE